MVGTPRYMAPEQLMGAPVDARCDQFGWGLMAYELLAGVHPWGTVESHHGLIDVICTRYPAPLLQVAPGVPPEVQTVVWRAIAKEPERRFATMDEIVTALEQSLATARAVTAPGAAASESRPASRLDAPTVASKRIESPATVPSSRVAPPATFPSTLPSAASPSTLASAAPPVAPVSAAPRVAVVSAAPRVAVVSAAPAPPVTQPVAHLPVTQPLGAPAATQPAAVPPYAGAMPPAPYPPPSFGNVPSWPQPPATAPPRRRSAWIIVLVSFAALVLLLAWGAFSALFWNGGSSRASPATATAASAATRLTGADLHRVDASDLLRQARTFAQRTDPNARLSGAAFENSFEGLVDATLRDGSTVTFLVAIPDTKHGAPPTTGELKLWIEDGGFALHGAVAPASETASLDVPTCSSQRAWSALVAHGLRSNGHARIALEASPGGGGGARWRIEVADGTRHYVDARTCNVMP
jgi:hypothetical protein